MTSKGDWPKLQAGFVAYRKGDTPAARAVFTALFHVLLPFIRLKVGNHADAEDITQACLLKIHFAREKYDESRPLKAWVYTVAVNTVTDHWRGRATQVATVMEDETDAAPDPNLAENLRFEFNDQLQKAMATLTLLDRTLVYLTGVEQLTMAEAAVVVNLSENAVKLRVSRGHKKLREALAGNDIKS